MFAFMSISVNGMAEQQTDVVTTGDQNRQVTVTQTQLEGRLNK